MESVIPFVLSQTVQHAEVKQFARYALEEQSLLIVEPLANTIVKFQVVQLVIAAQHAQAATLAIISILKRPHAL